MSKQFSFAEMAEEIGKLAWSKRVWLDGVGAKRPHHEIETRRRELAVLEQAEGDYRNASERKRA